MVQNDVEKEGRGRSVRTWWDVVGTRSACEEGPVEGFGEGAAWLDCPCVSSTRAAEGLEGPKQKHGGHTEALPGIVAYAIVF